MVKVVLFGQKEFFRGNMSGFLVFFSVALPKFERARRQ